MLAIKAECSKAQIAMDFFKTLYKEEIIQLPHGLELLFLLIYKTPLTDQQHCLAAAEHRTFNEKEITMSVSGLQDLSTIIQLAHNNTPILMHTLLMGLPLQKGGCCTDRLFLGVNQQNVGQFYLIKYHIHKSEDIQRRINGLDEAELKGLVHPADQMKNFTNPQECRGIPEVS